MEDDTPTPSIESLDRRTFLAGVGAAGIAGLAGCGGDGGEETDAEPAADESSPADQSTPEPTAPEPAGSGDTQAPGGGTESSGGGDGCPSPPLSYTRVQIPEQDTLVTVEVPDGPYASTSRLAGFGLSLGDQSGTTRLQPRAESRGSPAEAAEGALGTDETSEYDVPEGARVTVRRDRSDSDFPTTTTVYLPADSGYVAVEIYLQSNLWCPDAYAAIHRHLIESVRTA